MVPEGESVVVDQESGRALEEPRSKRTIRIVGGTAPMPPEEELLVHILCVVLRSSSLEDEPVSPRLVTLDPLVEGCGISIRVSPHKVLIGDLTDILRAALPLLLGIRAAGPDGDRLLRFAASVPTTAPPVHRDRPLVPSCTPP
jgi:hypothetical protein